LQERTWYVPIPRPKSLIKRVLSNLLAARGITLVREVDPSVRGEGSERPPRGTAWLDATSAFTLLGQDRLDNLQWCVEDVLRRIDPSVRGEGSERPPRGTAWLDATSAFTLLGQDRLDNLQWCVEDVLRRKVPGDMIETGVWRGGACILMRAILKAYGVRDRKVWAADSFEGLPPADPAQYPLDRHSTFHEQRGFAVSLEEVRHNFDKYGLLDDQVEFVKGWFCDTLPKLAGHT